MISLGMMKQRVTIERGSLVADDTGFVDPWTSPTVVASDVPCSLQPRSERTKVYSDGRVVNGSQIAYLNGPIDVRASDRLTVTSDPIATNVGKKYDVVKPQDAAGRGHHMQVGVEPFQPQRAA